MKTTTKNQINIKAQRLTQLEVNRRVSRAIKLLEEAEAELEKHELPQFSEGEKQQFWQSQDISEARLALRRAQRR